MGHIIDGFNRESVSVYGLWSDSLFVTNWNINLISEKKKKDRLEIYVPLLSFLDLGLIICVPEIQIQES